MSTAVIASNHTMPSTPGLYPGVPAQEYHQWPAASQSILKVMRDRSPAHARHEMLNPSAPTPAMRFGTALHTAVLQSDEFPKEYAVAPNVDRRTKVGRATWEEFTAEHEGKAILTEDEHTRIVAMQDAIMAHPLARKLLNGQPELSSLWRDSETDVLCKCRFDMLNPHAGVVVDLKTTIDASPRTFSKSIYNLGYHIQAAHYLIGSQAHGIGADLFAIVAVEKEPPYGVAVYQIEDQALLAGENELRPLIRAYAQCVETGRWPAYDEQAIRITLPRWAWSEIDERVGGSDDY